ncbi:MAG: hypothetical protein J6J55_06275, partial [Paludibacteraceae bacterium]|nr:hypothetical protein [Paludibacteraceae bacterium]
MKKTKIVLLQDPRNEVLVFYCTQMKNSTAVTTTTYDTYKRPNKKTYQIGGQTFSRTFTYEKTRLSYVSDSAGGDASILYDDCGRVRR